jgi:mRNA-degrading endonuclease RelE of RelBE toxin-antitoxin system
MYTVKYDKSVLKFLAKHPEIQERFLEKLFLMKIDPLDPSLDIKSLQ